VFDFENSVIQLFESHNLDFQFLEKKHLLKCRTLTISLIANCSAGELINREKRSVSSDRQTIIVWEDQYKNQRPVIESRIRSLLGLNTRLHARETRIKPLSQELMNDFLVVNHLNVPIKAKFRYGLYNKQNLVAVAAFGRSCPIQLKNVTYTSHELIRFASLLNHTVVGGLSKLIHHFEQEHQPEHIMTYVDREWSAGRSYIKLGFIIDGITEPQEFWLSPGQCERFYGSQLLKTKSRDKLIEEGWRSFMNHGNIKLIKILK
jgi:hypothetical protein